MTATRRAAARPLSVGLAALVGAAALAACTSTPDDGGADAVEGSVVLLSGLAGSTTPLTFVLRDDTPDLTEAKFYLSTDGTTYLATDTTAPFEHTFTVQPGANAVQVRHVVGGEEERMEAEFTAAGTPGASSAAPSPASTTSAPATSAPAGPPAGGAPGATTEVATVAELEAALEAATPGAVIQVADGVYQRDGGDRWVAAADGRADAPITLRGGRGAILESDSPDGDYGLHLTGSYWVVEGLAIRNATKGIVLDGSVGTVIDDVEVSNIGDEGVHFRACSSDGVLRNSFVHDTGVESPQYGEGVYVGSANSNWGDYGCGPNGEDDTEGTLVENNVFQDNAAEGADLKEGTDSGTLRGNTFENSGFSGENSADSAVDAKGNGWQIVGNTVTNPSGAFEDAFQTHSVYEGYGRDNRFEGNVVEGDVPGFGFGLYPEAGNVVTCDNTADGAAGGLVGADGDAADCTP